MLSLIGVVLVYRKVWKTSSMKLFWPHLNHRKNRRKQHVHCYKTKTKRPNPMSRVQTKEKHTDNFSLHLFFFNLTNLVFFVFCENWFLLLDVCVIEYYTEKVRETLFLFVKLKSKRKWFFVPSFFSSIISSNLVCSIINYIYTYIHIHVCLLSMSLFFLSVYQHNIFCLAFVNSINDCKLWMQANDLFYYR